MRGSPDWTPMARWEWPPEEPPLDTCPLGVQSPVPKGSASWKLAGSRKAR